IRIDARSKADVGTVVSRDHRPRRVPKEDRARGGAFLGRRVRVRLVRDRRETARRKLGGAAVSDRRAFPVHARDVRRLRESGNERKPTWIPSERSHPGTAFAPTSSYAPPREEWLLRKGHRQHSVPTIVTEYLN